MSFYFKRKICKESQTSSKKMEMKEDSGGSHKIGSKLPRKGG